VANVVLCTTVVFKTTLAARGGPGVVSSTTVVLNTPLVLPQYLGPTLQCPPFNNAGTVTEVGATVSLRYSDGFTRPLPSALTIVGYGISFYLLALVLKDISVSTTYAIWTGAGTAAVAIIGIAVLGGPAPRWSSPRSR
jgi:multidrug transporter EmrE-like cation transporter